MGLRGVFKEWKSRKAWVLEDRGGTVLATNGSSLSVYIFTVTAILGFCYMQLNMDSGTDTQVGMGSGRLNTCACARGVGV